LIDLGSSPQFSIRPAERRDVPEIVGLIRELSVYEKLTHLCRVDEASIERHLFGEPRYIEVLVAESEGRLVGMALYYHNYSTFLAKPGLYLEDLFVQPASRGRGIGKALLTRLIQVAAERGCGRVDWMVLDWNRPAIDFYEKAFQAELLGEWRLFRMTEDRFTAAIAADPNA